jgi:hypothetical protein
MSRSSRKAKQKANLYTCWFLRCLNDFVHLPFKKIWFRGRVARRRSAKPYTAVRIRSEPRSNKGPDEQRAFFCFPNTGIGKADENGSNRTTRSVVSSRPQGVIRSEPRSNKGPDEQRVFVVSCFYAILILGNLTVNLVSTPGSLYAVISPLLQSIYPLQIANPKPEPFSPDGPGLDLAVFISKISLSISWGMPIPLSIKSKVVYLMSFFPMIFTMPPWCEYFMALSMMLRITK